MIQGSNQHYCFTVAQLTGKELLAKVKELGAAASKEQVAREAGYYSTKKDGTERILYSAFHDALLQAQGLIFAPAVTTRAGRQLSYEAKVQANGNLIIGAGYTAARGYTAGHRFAIEPLEDGGFKLAPIYENEAPAESAAA